MKNKALFNFLMFAPVVVVPAVVSSCSAQGDSLDGIYNDINKKGIEISLKPEFLKNNINIKEIYQSFQTNPNTVLDFNSIYNQIPNLQKAIDDKLIIPSFTFSLPTPQEKDITIIVKFDFFYNPNRPNNIITKTYKLSELTQIKDSKLPINSWSEIDPLLGGYSLALEQVIKQFQPVIETYFNTLKYVVGGIISGMEASSLNSKVFDGQQPNILSYLENPGAPINPNGVYSVIFSTVASGSEFAVNASYNLPLKFGI
ncbi:MAG: hypothetical protein ACRDAW_00970 [Metamycoplasmataceae bacterium]